MQLTHQNSLLHGQWPQVFLCFVRMFRDCSDNCFINFHPIYARLMLLLTAVSASNHLSLWSAGRTLGLDVPVPDIPTWQILYTVIYRYHKRVGWCMCIGDLPAGHMSWPSTSNISSNSVQCSSSRLWRSHCSSEISCAFPWSCLLLGSNRPSACPTSTGWTLWATLRTSRSKRSGLCWRRWFWQWERLSGLSWLCYNYNVPYSSVCSLLFPFGRRSTRSGEGTRIFRDMFKYLLFCIGLLDGNHPRLWSSVLAFLLCRRMASAAAAATLELCKESLLWIWTLQSAPRVKSSFRHELLQTVYVHLE